MPTAAASASGTASARRRARCANGDSGAAPATSTTAIPRTSRWCASWGLDALRLLDRVAARPARRRAAAANEAGLDFYDRLVDELLAAGIEPCVTLYHWDLPQALEDAGGWPSARPREAFVDYAEAVGARLGDRVTRWITLNEPWVAAWLGYGWGMHAPGRTSDDATRSPLRTTSSSPTGCGVAALRELVGRRRGRRHVQPGAVEPRRHRRRSPTRPGHVDGYRNRWFLDPLFRGAYPDDMLATFGDAIRRFSPATWRRSPPRPTSSASTTTRVAWPSRRRDDDRPHVVVPGADAHRHGLGGLSRRACASCLVRLQRRLRAAGDLHHRERRRVRRRAPARRPRSSTRERARTSHATSTPSRERSPTACRVRGYFVWSLLDNFEWAHGYGKRFGIVYVDFATLERVPKSSFYWYRDFAAAPGEEGPDRGPYRPDALNGAGGVRPRFRADAARGRGAGLRGRRALRPARPRAGRVAAWLADRASSPAADTRRSMRSRRGCRPWRRRPDARLPTGW